MYKHGSDETEGQPGPNVRTISEFVLDTRDKRKINFSHLNKKNMVMAMLREMSESVYPAVYMVFT